MPILHKLKKYKMRCLTLENQENGLFAYGEQFSLLSYYITSSADKIYMNKEGMINWIGIGGEGLLQNLLS